MKSKDIEVGQFYVNTQFPELIYLGCGKRVMWKGTFENPECEFTNKRLVIVSSNYDNVGQFVQARKNCQTGFWDCFKKLGA